MILKLRDLKRIAFSKGNGLKQNQNFIVIYLPYSCEKIRAKTKAVGLVGKKKKRREREVTPTPSQLDIRILASYLLVLVILLLIII